MQPPPQQQQQKQKRGSRSLSQARRRLQQRRLARLRRWPSCPQRRRRGRQRHLHRRRGRQRHLHIRWGRRRRRPPLAPGPRRPPIAVAAATTAVPAVLAAAVRGRGAGDGGRAGPQRWRHLPPRGPTPRPPLRPRRASERQSDAPRGRGPLRDEAHASRLPWEECGQGRSLNNKKKRVTMRWGRQQSECGADRCKTTACGCEQNYCWNSC